MRKFLSVILALMMAVSVFAVASISAFAVESPTATTAGPTDIIIEINGGDANKDVTYTINEVNGTLVAHFEYNGEGKLIGWNDNLASLSFVAGVDYTRTVESDGSLTLTFISDAAIAAAKNGKVVVNAVVEFPDGQTTTVKVNENDSSKSPSTGVATSVIAGSIAVAGAGIAVLSATKKRDAE